MLQDDLSSREIDREHSPRILDIPATASPLSLDMRACCFFPYRIAG
jgi:hypothetical protein